MVSTASPRMALACNSNCESRCERSVTRPLSWGRGRTSAKYTSSLRTSSSTPNTPRPPVRVDDARRDRIRGVQGGERHPLWLPRLERSRRRPAGGRSVRRSAPAGPDGSVVRTVSSVTSSSTPTTVSAITRLCGVGPRRRQAARPGRRRRPATPPTGRRRVPQRRLTTSGKPAWSATAAQLLHRGGEPERHGRQAELVAGQPAQPLRSIGAACCAASETPRWSRARRRRSAPRPTMAHACGRRSAGSPSRSAVSSSASFILTTAARSATPCAGASAYWSTAMTSAPEPVWNASANSRLNSPEPSSITVDPVGAGGVVVRDRLRRGRRIAFSSFRSSHVQPARCSAQPDVDVAPPPVSSRLGGAHHRMTGRVDAVARACAGSNRSIRRGRTSGTCAGAPMYSHRALRTLGSCRACEVPARPGIARRRLGDRMSRTTGETMSLGRVLLRMLSRIRTEGSRRGWLIVGGARGVGGIRRGGPAIRRVAPWRWWSPAWRPA